MYTDEKRFTLIKIRRTGGRRSKSIGSRASINHECTLMKKDLHGLKLDAPEEGEASPLVRKSYEVKGAERSE